MSVFMTFLFKEIKEQFKNFKAIILAVVLLIIGMSSPLIAKIMPDIFKSMNTGLDIHLPPPVFLDAYTQFFKNITQMGIFIIVIVFSGSIAHEKSKGTAQLILSRGLSRTSFVLAKFFSSAALWTVTFFLSALMCYGYTAILFKDQDPKNLFLSMLCLWLFVILLLSVSTFAGLFGNSVYGSILGTFAFWGLLIVTAIPKSVKAVSPRALTLLNIPLLTGAKGISDLYIPFLITIGLILLFITGSVYIFSKQEI